MSIDLLYKFAAGRFVIILLQRVGAMRAASWFLKTRFSEGMIGRYIEKHNIDMEPFGDQKYRSFAEFFSRKKNLETEAESGNVLISPCDGLLSIYPVFDKLRIPMKGSLYRLEDIVPDKETAAEFSDGICLVFRLRPEDYHHFCAFDGCSMESTSFIPGKLHSVRPIAGENVPVYRMNRRWWSVLNTDNFETVVQIEVGAMLVGGIALAKTEGRFIKGEEMGNFELAGSTIILLMNSETRKTLNFDSRFKEAVCGEKEIPVTMGEAIGIRGIVI